MANQGQFEEAEGLLIAGMARAPMWPRIWTQAAQAAGNIEKPELTVYPTRTGPPLLI